MARGNARARATLRYNTASYTPYALHDWPITDLKKEYTRLRNIAMKRIKRLQADPEGRQSTALQVFAEGAPLKIGDMKGSRTILEREMANLALFLRNPQGTVGGVREANRKKAKMAGMEPEQLASTYKTLDEWMEYARAQGLFESYGSEESRDYYYDAAGIDMTAADMETWYNDYHAWALKRQRENEPEEGSNSEEFAEFTNPDFLF